MSLYENVPCELKEMDQWVCHRFPNKAPLCPFPNENGDLAYASCRKPETWGSFGTAVKAVQHGWAKGIGIEITNGIIGIDIDHCIDSGELSSAAKEIIEFFGSYAEISPSGTGVHVLIRGVLPVEGHALRKSNLEAYDDKRYFIVTGNAFLDSQGLPYPLRECQEKIANFVRHLKGEPR